MPEDKVLESSLENHFCSNDKYWVRPHQRKKISKHGKIYIENVRGYCCSFHANYHKMAEEEKMPYDHLFLALTIYGEARDQNDASIRAIAWIIRNRYRKKGNKSSYHDVVLSKDQFGCWKPTDPNYERLQYPGKEGSLADKKAWETCKQIAEEIHNAPEEENPLPGVYNYFSGEPNVSWEKDSFDLPGIAKFHFVKL